MNTVDELKKKLLNFDEHEKIEKIEDVVNLSFYK